MRAAIDWAFSAKGDVEAGVTLTIACLPLWTHFSLNGECLRYVEQALLAGRASHGWNDRREMQLLAALGALLIYAKGPGPEADAAWTKALKIAEAVDDADYQVRALWGLWSSLFNSGKFRMSLNPAEKLREVAANAGDTAAALVGERSVGMTLFYLGDLINGRHRTNPCFANMSGRAIGHTSSDFNLIHGSCLGPYLQRYSGRRDFPIKPCAG